MSPWAWQQQDILALEERARPVLTSGDTARTYDKQRRTGNQYATRILLQFFFSIMTPIENGISQLRFLCVVAAQ